MYIYIMYIYIIYIYIYINHHKKRNTNSFINHSIKGAKNYKHNQPSELRSAFSNADHIADQLLL